MATFKEIIPQYIESTHTGCLQSVVNLWNRKFPTPKIYLFFLKARQP